MTDITIVKSTGDGGLMAQKPITVVAPLGTLTSKWPDVSNLPASLYSLGEFIKSVYEWEVVRAGAQSKKNETQVLQPGFSSWRDGALCWGFDVTVYRDARWEATYKGVYRYNSETSRMAFVEAPTFANNPFSATQTVIEGTGGAQPPSVPDSVVQAQIQDAIKNNPGVPVFDTTKTTTPDVAAALTGNPMLQMYDPLASAAGTATSSTTEPEQARTSNRLPSSLDIEAGDILILGSIVGFIVLMAWAFGYLPSKKKEVKQ